MPIKQRIAFGQLTFPLVAKQIRVIIMRGCLTFFIFYDLLFMPEVLSILS